MTFLSTNHYPGDPIVQSYFRDHGKVTIAIHQPGYHRYSWYFYKMLLSDIFVSLDTVQFVKRERQNRQLFFYDDALRRLSLPINNGRTPIQEKKLIDPSTLQAHWEIIQRIYKHTPFFAHYLEQFEVIYKEQREYLNDLCDALILTCKEILGISTLYLRASNFYQAHQEIKKGELIGDIIHQLVGTHHLDKTIYLPRAASSNDSEFYLNQIFDESGLTEEQKIKNTWIDVSYYEFSHPIYKQHQLHNQFIPYLSIIDLIFNHGPQARHILEQSGTKLQHLCHITPSWNPYFQKSPSNEIYHVQHSPTWYKQTTTPISS